MLGINRMNQSRPAEHWKWIALSVLMMWAYFPTLAFLWSKWMDDPQYSHGLLVPLFSAYLLFTRKETMPMFGTPIPFIGGFLLLSTFALRSVAGLLYIPELDGYSLLIALTGLVMFLGGWTMLRWSWPAIFFLVFMLPLPYRISIMMGGPLQSIATWASTFALQTLGQPAIAEGNTILINDVKLGVAEACSGLRMLMTFLAFSCGAVFLMQRSWIEKIIVVASAIPIALLTNLIRIVMTGLAYVYLSNTSGVVDFLHDAYGWLMMPIGLGFLLLELWVLSKLLIMPEDTKKLKR